MDTWLAYSDGYRMTWEFDTPSVIATKEGAIDAVCIWSEFGQGMMCKGVIYIGIGVLAPQRWAKWISNEQKLKFDVSKPLDGTDDLKNWYQNTAVESFTGIWSEYRWLPKQQL